jgi:formylmethanofuran dehydrogenase subunit B
MAVLQSRGWVMSTLTEVRNRADLVVVVGDGIGASFPRFYQRVVGAAETMFGSLSRRIVFIGSGADRTLVDPGVTSETIACLPDQLGSAIGSLRAALRGRPVPGATGVNPEAIAALAQRIQAARYPVVVWAPLPLPETDGDLIVLSIADLVRDLNVGGRAAGLSLGGNDGGATAQAVTAWQTGYPLRVSLATGKPIYDPVRFDIARMLPAGEGDALIWTAAISAELGPPATTIPTIVLGTPGLTLARTPEVFIPVGTPGLDHAGDLIRTDSVVSLQLRGWRNVGLPTVADIALRIAAHVTDRPES